MREIKFRGKRVDNGEWVEGYYQCLPNKNYASITGINAKGAMEGWRVIYGTVGQFTGLLDKNGVEIYEGDIVHIDNYDEGWDSVVEFNGGAFAVDVEGRDYDYTAIGWTEYQSIIIGNIHEGETPCTSAIVE